MDHLTRQRIARQSAEDHQRRATQAEREGVRVMVDARTGQHVATSASDASRCYHVSIEGCTCRGFVFRGRCKHHSLLLAELGRIPDCTPSLVAGLSDADVIALKADAARRHYLHGEPLVNVMTGEIIDTAPDALGSPPSERSAPQWPELIARAIAMSVGHQRDWR